MPADEVRAQLLRAASQTLLLVIVSTAATTALTIASGFLIMFALFDLPWATFWAGRGGVGIADVPAGIMNTLTSGALAGAFCWFVLPIMARRSWELAAKIAGVFAFNVLARLVLAFV